MSLRILFRGVCAALLLSLSATLVYGAVPNRVVAAVSSSERATLGHHVSAKALKAADMGPADPSLVLGNLTLRFSLTASQQATLTELLLEQQQVNSANYHKWLTPEQYAAQFGLSADDLAKVTAWLTGQGFKITGTARSATFVSFSGTAAQVQKAFGTTIHTLSLDGESHYANLTDPTVPAAFANVVTGITGLHNFRLTPHVKSRLVAVDSVHGEFTSSVSGSHYIAPGDFYTIYDETPLMAAAINGTGLTVAVMGQTDISLTDVAAFRSASGLTANVPTVKLYGTDPGTSKNDIDEAQLDVEWTGVSAPSATILYVNSTDVIDTSLTDAIDNNLAPIMTVSYGDCEANYGQAALNTFNLLFQQANAQGITIVGPGGDSGAADCDYDVTSATQGLAVDFPASSPFVTGVGGTMFNEGSANYFSATNNSYGGSAISYIPEAAWNETATAGSLAAGGGGASAFFAKPAWQVGTGVPTDSSRDVPDLSLDAAANHDGFLFCSQGSCTNGFRNSGGFLNVVGGTSIATPSFAGVLALVEQRIGSRIGNANPNIYALANSTYYANVFHDVSTGNNSVPCTTGSVGCLSGGTIGYNATAGYDLATGWGSIDTYNLVNDWSLVPALSAGVTTLSNTTLTASSSNVVAGATVTITASVASASSSVTTVPTGSIQFYVDNVASGSAMTLTSGSVTLSLPTTNLASGAHTISAAYSGNTMYAGSKRAAVIDVTSDFTLVGSASSITVKAGATAVGVTYTLTSLSNFAGSVALTASSSTLNASGGFSVTPVVLTAGGTGTSVFTLSAYVSSATKSTLQAANHPPSAKPWEFAGGSMAFASVLLILLPGRRRRLTGAAGIFSVLLLAVGAMGTIGCGSNGSTAAASTTVNSATGTYAVTITATSGAISHSTNLTVVVD